MCIRDSATGEERWKYDPNISDNIFSPTADPVVHDGVVYFMVSDINLTGVLYAIDLNTHQLRWEHKTSTENFSAPAILDDILVWGSLEGILNGVSAADGKVLWTFPTEDIIFSAPAIAGNTVYFGSYDKNLYAVDYRTGKLLWQFRAESGVSSPAIDNGIVYVGTVDGAFYAIQ